MKGKLLLGVLLCGALLTMGRLPVQAGILCEQPTGKAGTLCGGQVQYTVHETWTPLQLCTPCTTHHCYDHGETTYVKAPSVMETCSRCEYYRWAWTDGQQVQPKSRLECQSRAK